MFILISCENGKNGYGHVGYHNVIINTEHITVIEPNSTYPRNKCFIHLNDGTKLSADCAVDKVLPVDIYVG